MFRYWGKARPSSDEGPNWHPLVYHSLDVAAVAAAWWQRSWVIRDRFSNTTGTTDEALARAWILFFVALHDYGKLDIRFQLKAPEVLQTIYPEFDSDMAEADARYYHGPGGYAWFMYGDSIHLDLNEEQLDSWQPWLRAVTGHHGSLPDDPRAISPDADEHVIGRDRFARLAWLRELERLFLKPVGLDLTQLPPACPDHFLAGFCAVCDWLGSDDQRFVYRDDEQSLDTYWEYAGGIADNAFAASGLYRDVIGTGGMRQLFPSLQARQVQTLVDALPVAPGLTLVEAPTGSGKTEMALAYAARLLASGVVESIVFALPTQATANAMLARLEKAAGQLFAEGANVVLAHGKDRFNPNFQSLKEAAQRRSVQTAEQEREAKVQCVQWLGASRKRAFLGQIGVCTIDQVLLSILPVRHQFVRAFGLRKSILIVDEVHAYDAYMYGLLGRVLDGQRWAGGSALLLSATLPLHQKEALVSAWGDELIADGLPEQTPYPLITRASGEGDCATWEPDRDQRPAIRIVKTEHHESPDLLPDAGLCRRIIAAAEQGALVGIVCNLVADAQALALKLRGSTEVSVDLFHARYRFVDRQTHELNAIRRYGGGTGRCRGRILVATQVIEQSLDLDFDWLISQLCPVDLLFQRLGRLHRHDRKDRPAGFAEPKCTVLLPDTEDYGLHGKVYGCERVLWRTRQLLAGHDSIMFPEAYRTWIERVYQAEPWPDEPAAVTERYEQFVLDEFGRYFSARQLSKSDATPWPDTEGGAARLTRDGDSSLSVLLVQQTTEGLALLDGRRLDTLAEHERDELINLNTVGVPASWGKWLDSLEEDAYRLVLQRTSDDRWEGQSRDRLFVYTEDLGLMLGLVASG